jgi:ABC-type multidrug transport system permease subunit
MNSTDWVKIILSVSVLVVMLGLIVSIVIHGSTFAYSEIGITALAGIMGAIVGVLGNFIRRDDDSEKDEDFSPEED